MSFIRFSEIPLWGVWDLPSLYREGKRTFVSISVVPMLCDLYSTRSNEPAVSAIKTLLDDLSGGNTIKPEILKIGRKQYIEFVWVPVLKNNAGRRGRINSYTANIDVKNIRHRKEILNNVLFLTDPEIEFIKNGGTT